VGKRLLSTNQCDEPEEERCDPHTPSINETLKKGNHFLAPLFWQRLAKGTEY